MIIRIAWTSSAIIDRVVEESADVVNEEGVEGGSDVLFIGES